MLMNPRALQTNEEVFEYLVQLGSRLEEVGNNALAEVVIQSSRFASGSASEFFNEAELAVQQVVKQRPVELSESELKDAEAVLAQIKEAFLKIGGA